MTTYLDFSKIKNLRQLHNYLEETLDLPGYYGRNLDALWDVLSADRTERDYQITGMDELRNEIGEYADRLLKVFEDLKNEQN